MPRSGLTGGRIREKRVQTGLRQSALAKAVGISPAYLNLIEHNRRRIGGKLLVDISRQLGVDPSMLSQGAESTLLATLSDAASNHPQAGAETERIEEFTGRFPGWSALIAAQFGQGQALERAVKTLSDRLTHDPQLADSVHEVLSVVTAIHATSGILAEEAQVDPEWQARFHRNLYEDSQRLADSAQALVEYLAHSEEKDTPSTPALPQEQLETWLERQNFQIPALEGKNPQSVRDVMLSAPALKNSAPIEQLGERYLTRYRDDAARLPKTRLVDHIRDNGLDPLAIAAEFDCDFSQVLRRLSQISLPDRTVGCGLLVCDGSGALSFVKPVSGFNVARFGASCPLWPLYQALSQPMVPLKVWLAQTGHRPQRFLSYAIAQPQPAGSFDMPALFEATMLILPDDADAPRSDENVRPVGSGCRTCSRTGCSARREPSILTSGF